MIVLVAGIPSAHFNRIQQLAPRIFGRGVVFLGSPLRRDGDGGYRPDAAHADRIVEVLLGRIRQQPRIMDGGVGVLVLAQAAARPEAFTEAFRPFALSRTVELSDHVETKGRPGDMAANAMARDLGTAFLPLARAVSAMVTEFRTRLNRTPLLLPLRNFSSAVVRPTIADLFTALPRSERPADDIAEACRTIEATHPFDRFGGSNRRCFKDDRRIQYRSPARAHHGMAASTEPPHDRDCYLNGNLRLGGRFVPGFHYDCIRDFSEGRRELPLKGTFANCHGGSDHLTGTNHVNVAPNDYCRI